jgi:pimeloyl-ACP methyl ester carboxylesterase
MDKPQPRTSAGLQPEHSDIANSFTELWRSGMPAMSEWFSKGSSPTAQLVQDGFDYWLDFWQRSILFFDVLRQRGNNYVAHTGEETPNVLGFEFELVMGGRTLERPVNYGLVRILPRAGMETKPRLRPFIVFDPRAGHGPGIGGMKHDSEIGVALAAGHPCYFVGFVPDPVPGQTIEDVCRAEAIFIEKVIALHPDADGKPVLIGNCQAGWQIMMTAALRSDLVGPIILAGSPLSYWQGVHGKYPLRYLGGLLGGSWLASLAGDLGDGVFDGAHLVANFESLDPANTLWKKNYNLYSKIDTEPPRFLEFEKWWGSPVLLNAREMQAIADGLFIGNKLASGELYTSDGIRVDLRAIKSPIIVFCSWGDNITPPQQALGWILDLYDEDEEIVANGQTIVYTLHETIGHLGIFVSAKVATKEHQEFTQTMDLIDVLPPGLYEAVMTKKTPDTRNSELISGDHVVHFKPRTLDALRALGGNDAADDRRFATAARVSEINQGLYRMFLSPLVQAATSAHSAELLRRLHPNRQRFEGFSDENPATRGIAQVADAVRHRRRPVSEDNPFLALQRSISGQIVDALDRYRDARDWWMENVFLAVYGSPFLQAMVGLQSDFASARSRLGRDTAREAAAAKAAAELDAHIEQGGLSEGAIRALVYITLPRSADGVDERSFNLLRQFRDSRPEDARLSLQGVKQVFRDQYLMLRLDEKRAVAAIPSLLSAGAKDQRGLVLDLIRRVVAIGENDTAEVKRRLEEVEALFEKAEASGRLSTMRKSTAARETEPPRREMPGKAPLALADTSKEAAATKA